MNYHENKELLQLRRGGGEMERKGGRAKNDFADKSSTLLNLCWHRKKTNIRKVMLQFSTVALSFSFSLLVQNTYKYAALLEAASLNIKRTFQRLCTI